MADPSAPPREPKEQRYLSLNPDVEFDPRVACLSARLYKMFVSLRMMALRGEEPGVLDMAWPALCRALGVRSPLLQEKYAQELEELRLIGFRKNDDAIVIARWTLPQLDVQGFKREPLPPRKRYPSDEARLKRPAQADADATTAEADAQGLVSMPSIPPADVPAMPPSPALQQFFGAEAGASTSPLPAPVPAPAEASAQSGAEACGVAAEAAALKETEPNKERNKEAKASPPKPPVAESGAECAEAGQAGGQGCACASDTERREVEVALIAEGVNPGNARKLAFAPDADIGDIYAQIAALPFRGGSDPPGLLVTVIREHLPLPPAYLDQLKAQEASRRKAGEQEEAQRQREARLRESDAQVARIVAQTTQGVEGNHAVL